MIPNQVNEQSLYIMEMIPNWIYSARKRYAINLCSSVLFDNTSREKWLLWTSIDWIKIATICSVNVLKSLTMRHMT